MQNIRPFLIITLTLCTLGISLLAQAEELYRWREADGTLTFSPVPPPANSGIAYEKVSPQTGAISAANVQTPALVVPATPSLLAQQPTRIASSNKTEHCSELRKRVQSLERLIMTDVSAEIMDNAVVQMARYQNSFNQACRGLLQ